MEKLRKLFEKPGFCLLLFFLRLIFFGWPILSIVNKDYPETVFIYLFLVWGVFILLLYFMSRCYDKSASVRNKNDKERG